MKREKPDFIFKCYKCSLEVYVDKKDVLKILKKDCSKCGEEPYENWVLIGEGDFDNR